MIDAALYRTGRAITGVFKAVIWMIVGAAFYSHGIRLAESRGWMPSDCLMSAASYDVLSAQTKMDEDQQ